MGEVRRTSKTIREGESKRKKEEEGKQIMMITVLINNNNSKNNNNNNNIRKKAIMQRGSIEHEQIIYESSNRRMKQLMDWLSNSH